LSTPYPARFPSFARLLGAAGYTTGFFTANVVIGKNFGMQTEFEHVEYGPAEDFHWGPKLTSDCETWLATVGEQSPTCVYIHYHPPHGPYHPPAPFVQRARQQSVSTPNGLAGCCPRDADLALAADVLGRIPWYQAMRTLSTDLVDYEQRYEANIAFADSLAEGFFEMWGRLRSHRPTVFFVTGDHGEALGEHGLVCDHGKLLIDEILHVPLLMHETTRSAGRVVDDPVSHLDLGLTILEMAGAPQPFGLINQSLLRPGPPARPIVSHQMDWLRGEGAFAVTAGRWRLVYNPGARYGSGTIMEVRAGDPGPTTLTGVPLQLPPTTLRAPVRISGDNAKLTSFAFEAPVLAGEEAVRFVGSFDSTSRGRQLILRARSPAGDDVLLGPFDVGDFVGQIATAAGFSERIVVEAALHNITGNAVDENDWHFVLSAPVLSPSRLCEALEILGCQVSPAHGVPGDSLHLTLNWRAYTNVDADTGTVVELVSSDGEVVLRETRAFFLHFPNPGAEPGPLVNPKMEVATTFSENSLEFEDAFWWTLPTSLAPGTYQIMVGLCDLDWQDPEKKLVRRGPSAPAAKLEVCTSRSHLLRLHLSRRLGTGDLRLPVDWTPKPADVPALREEARRFPNLGHLDFLLAADAADETENRRLLHRCLRKTPLHLPALDLLAASGDEDSRRLVSRLAPSNPLSVDFGNIAKLAGFDLCRGETSVYVTLYWCAEAASGLLLAGELAVTSERATDQPTHVTYPWFIGGEHRPTVRWQPGETVVETLRVRLESGMERISLVVRVAEHWRSYYSGRRGPFLVTSGNGAEMHPITADLGRHRIDDLPACRSDFLARKRTNPAECVLVDLIGDPQQLRDHRREEPTVFARLQRQLGAVVALGDEPVPWANDEGERELSEETKDKLRALGYVD